MERVTNLSLMPTEAEKQNFRVSILEARVRELEHLVHALLRDRVHQEEADVWLDLAENQKSATPSVDVLKDRGKRMAAFIDRWPDKQKWTPRQPLT